MKTTSLSILTVVALAFVAFSPAGYGDDRSGSEPDALELFNQRIMPIFRSPNPSSCVQCHLAAVDLKNYIKPSHEETFASLRVQGLIDLDDPTKSKILKLIEMGDKDADKGAKLIHEKTRKAEYEAFAAWIEACCADETLRSKPMPADFQPARPARSDAVIRHARKSRVVESFVRNVWSQRMRCFPCHTPHEIDPHNPQHKKPAERQAEMVKKFGQKINLFRETPEETLNHLIASSRKPSKTRLPMLNIDDPRKSLLVLKPTAKLPPKKDDGTFQRPSAIEPVSHMGGLKMHVDDQSYKAFVTWIQDYANVVGDRYESVADLPADNWQPTLRVLRVKDLPDSWPVGTPVQLFVHAWSESDQAWVDDPIAFTQGTITPRHIVNGALFLLGDRSESPDQPSALKPGKHRVGVYVDLEGRIAEDPTAMLDENDGVGHVEFDAKWQEGFRNAEMVSASDLQK